ncbi:Hpt domain-containing protein [Xinfangfangia sp. CPCC 101601]|uniref:Hpt domain-containing protein n=1 Tax=Pseudogemmobacter lacusdianii TaxID=3069608 RepID=A0ABU0VTV3_9RHOB|nr:Hpt domain-containing protein [Xinfangfangia sp. CPCC 101601]MDQ2065164.1 Hpt domain-containing protein [Xinfangfangia sp. CPCC 101601]
MIDHARLDELRAEIGDDDLGDVVALFLEEADELIYRLTDGIAPEKLGPEMHFLKGAALNLGLSDLAALCQEGERLAGNGEAHRIEVDRVISTYHASRIAFTSALAKLKAA